jgi:UDP:flavonoid glycosyltransferase YjiC (YdhE family)
MSQAPAGCAVSINHGGQGTALTALATGCPQLVLPQFDDQFDNADAVVKAGAGIRLLLAEVTPTAVARACRDLLADADCAAAATAVAEQIAAAPSAVRVVGQLAGLA